MSNLSNFNSLMKQSWSGVAVLSVFYIVIVIALSLMSPWFFSFNNAMNIGINMSYIGLMAAAGTPLIGLDDNPHMIFFDTRKGSTNNATGGSGDQIGFAKVFAFENHDVSGGSADTKFDLYLFFFLQLE